MHQAAIKKVLSLIALYLDHHGYAVRKDGDIWQVTREGAVAYTYPDQITAVGAATESYLKTGLGRN